MALSDAVLEIAGRMESEAVEIGEYGKREVTRTVLGFARELRLALKASEGVPPSAPQAQPRQPPSHRELIDAARAELRGNVGSLGRLLQLEDDTPRTVEARGGRADGEYVQAPAGMPEEARMVVGTEVYQLRGGALHYDQEATRRYHSGESDG